MRCSRVAAPFPAGGAVSAAAVIIISTLLALGSPKRSEGRSRELTVLNQFRLEPRQSRSASFSLLQWSALRHRVSTMSGACAFLRAVHWEH